MQKSFRYSDRRGLPGGPNEESSFGEGFVVSERGQWDYPGMNTLVPTDGNITMQGVPYPVMAQPLYPDWAQPAVGPATMMYPDQDYYFPGAVAVAETPMARYGGGLTKYQKKGEVSTEEKPKVIPEIQISAAESDRRKAEREYNKRRLDFIQSKMQDYIRSQGQFGKNWGLSMQNFPEHEMMNYANEFDYKENTKSAEQIAKNKGYNLKDRASYVDKLTPTERNIIANSQYGANLQPSVWARTAGGLQELGNTLLPGQPFQFDVPGLSPKEEKEYRESALSGLNALAPFDLPGIVIANYAKNRGLSTGSNYAELPNLLSGQTMGNVSELDAALLNPATWQGLASLPSLARSIPSIYKSGKALASSEASKLYETFGSQPFLRNFIPTRLSKPAQSANTNIPTATTSGSALENPTIDDIIHTYHAGFWRNKMRQFNTDNIFPRNAAGDYITTRSSHDAREYFSNIVDRYQDAQLLESNILANPNLNITEFLRTYHRPLTVGKKLPDDIPYIIRTELPNFERFVNNYNRQVGQLSPSSISRVDPGIRIDRGLPLPDPEPLVPTFIRGVDVRRPINGHAPGTPEWDMLNNELIQAQQLRRAAQPPTQQWGTVVNATGPKTITNRSGLSKEQAIQRASSKDKDVISKMSESEFENTVLKPTGEIVPYEQSFGRSEFANSQNVASLSTKEYVDEFNSKLDLLNDIIARNNKSGVEFEVKGLDEYGRLTFTSPFGETSWGTRITPGQWRGNVEDIVNRDYFRSIPGLEMGNTTSGVFADNIVRRGTGAYESINEYLKRLDLGRVKPGFNSQTKYSRGLWENAIKKGKAVGFYGNPSTVYGTMKTVLPYAIPTGLGAGALQQYLQQPQGTYQTGGMSDDDLTEMLPQTGIDFTTIPDDVLAIMIANNR